MPNNTPPFAVPSSLVTISPVTPAALRIPLLVQGRFVRGSIQDQKHFVRSSRYLSPATRRIFSSSAIRFRACAAGLPYPRSRRRICALLRQQAHHEARRTDPLQSGLDQLGSGTIRPYCQLLDAAGRNVSAAQISTRFLPGRTVLQVSRL